MASKHPASPTRRTPEQFEQDALRVLSIDSELPDDTFEQHCALEAELLGRPPRSAREAELLLSLVLHGSGERCDGLDLKALSAVRGFLRDQTAIAEAEQRILLRMKPLQASGGH